MTSPLTGSLHRLGFLGAALAAGLAGAGEARAQGVSYGRGLAYGHGVSYGQPAPYGYSDSYAGPLIAGDYIGAPLTRVPRPTELVPSAWGYGTYGIPTVSGIRSAPVGTPTVYVIETPRGAARAPRQARSRILSRGRDGRWSQASENRVAPSVTETPGSARIVTVRVPGRQANLR